jgi:hypothetical protein
VILVPAEGETGTVPGPQPQWSSIPRAGEQRGRISGRWQVVEGLCSCLKAAGMVPGP